MGAFPGLILAGGLAAWLGWRAPFIVLSVPVLILVLLGLRLREPSRGIQERMAMGVTDALLTEEPPPSFAEGWRTVWKIESLRRIFFALPFLAASLVGFASLASLLYQQKFGLDVVQRGWVAAAAEPAQLVGLAIGAHVSSKLIVKDPGLIIRFLAVVAAVAAGLLVLFALVPILWITILVNMAVTASLAAIGAGIYGSLSLAIPARSRSLGFSMGALSVIPGLIILPIIGAIADTAGIRIGMLILVPVFLIGGPDPRPRDGHRPGHHPGPDVGRRPLRGPLRPPRGSGQVVAGAGLNVYYGQVQVLFDVDLEVDEGEIIALLGTNCVGKSTLLKAICGVVEADKGAVIFDGRDITHVPPNEIAAFGITQVPGGQGVFPGLSVEENLRVAGWLDCHRRQQNAQRVTEVLDMFPALASRLGDPAANLSGGQQQMLALSMAFLARPRLLLIDELSLGLAPVVVEQLLPVIELIRSWGTTVILVEQSVNLAVVDGADRLLHGEGRDPVPRTDLGAAGATGHLALGFPGRRRHPNRCRPGPVGAGHLGERGGGGNSDGGAGAGVARPGGGERHTGPGGPGSLVCFGGIQAVSDVTLLVAPAEIVGVNALNGAGKTTLLDLISGFTRAESGVVRIGGIDVTRFGPDRRARLGLGRSFQDAMLFPAMTVEETITVALKRWAGVAEPPRRRPPLPAWMGVERRLRHAVDELIELLSLGAYRSKLVRELSTGTCRVVDLACVVAHRPSVVLLDEPLSGIAQRESEALGPLLIRIRDLLAPAWS